MTEERKFSIRTEEDIISSREVGKQMAAEIGMSLLDQVRISTAISEMARNVISYADSGEIHFKYLGEKRDGLEITVRDSGPGIADVDLMMQTGYTPSGDCAIGLTGTKNLMDEFYIQSELGKGTTVTVRKWKQ